MTVTRFRCLVFVDGACFVTPLFVFSPLVSSLVLVPVFEFPLVLSLIGDGGCGGDVLERSPAV